MIPHHSSSSKEVRTGTQAGQEPGGRSRGWDHGGMLLTALFIMVTSTCFLIGPRTISPGMASPEMGWNTPPPPTHTQQSLIKKMLHRLAYNVILWRHFSIMFPSSQMTVACVKLT
jgi:hypothetical protein